MSSSSVSRSASPTSTEYYTASEGLATPELPESRSLPSSGVTTAGAINAPRANASAEIARDAELVRRQQQARYAMYQYAMRLLHADPIQFFRWHATQQFSERENFEFAKNLLEKEPRLFASNFRSFQIKQDYLISVLAKRLSEKSMFELEYNIANFDIRHPKLIAHLIVEMTKYDIVDSGSILDVNEIIKKIFRPGINLPSIKDLSGAAAAMGNKNSVITGIQARSKNQSNEYVRVKLSNWADYTSLLFRDISLTDVEWESVKNSFDAIEKWRSPTMRYQFSIALADHLQHDTPGFIQFAADFTRPHTRLLPVLLYGMKVSGSLSDDLSNSLRAELSRDQFKDIKKLKVVVNSLLALTQANHLDNDTKSKILGTAASTIGRTENGKTLMDAMHLVRAISLLSKGESELSRATLESAKTIDQKTNFGALTGLIFSNLFHLRNSDLQGDLSEKILDYQEKSRYPSALLTYATMLHDTLEVDEKGPVLSRLADFVRVHMLSDDPTAFKRLRYDTELSPHLAFISRQAPAAFEAWKQESVFMAPSARHGISTGRTGTVKIKDSDDPEDLLLCGTEVPTCQSVEGEGTHGKELLGYILDGKYRLIAACAPDGTISGRRIIRLLWDENTARPVIHLEKLYKHTGFSDLHDQEILSLARQKARSMKCDIVISEHSGDNFLNLKKYPNSVVSYPSSCPYEYVDSSSIRLGSGFGEAVKGKEGYTLSNLRFLG